MLRARYPPGYVGQIQLVTLLAGVVLEASRAIPAGVCWANTIGYATRWSRTRGFTRDTRWGMSDKYDWLRY